MVNQEWFEEADWMNDVLQEFTEEELSGLEAQWEEFIDLEEEKSESYRR